MPRPPAPRVRYRFADFVVSPSRRQVLCRGREVALIPRYFDLLLLLVERRGEAIPRREILDLVWSDVVVSDGALSQAVRSLRRALDDDPRQPRFIRTVSRHGYRFDFAEIVEEPDAADAAPPPATVPVEAEGDRSGDDLARSLERLLEGGSAMLDDDERRAAAERLLDADPEEILRKLDGRPGHEAARALLRDARWDVPGSHRIPLLGRPGALLATSLLLRLRFHRVVRLAGRRWLTAVGGAALAGAAAGLAGGIVLRFGPGSAATSVVLAILPVLGAVIGGLGATGVAAGLVAAEVLLRSLRRPALVVAGALGGGAVGAASHLLGAWMLEGLFGRGLAPVAGGFEGTVLGAAVGLGYAIATPTLGGGMAAPRAARRGLAVVAAGAACGGAAALLGLTGSHLGALSLDFMARSFPGSQVGLDPLAQLLGESAPGPLTRTAICTFEGFAFGSGLIWGLTIRPRG